MEQALRVKLIIRLCGGEDGRGFGPGVMTLMEQVAEKKSLRSAAAAMSMAYSKAWRIMHAAEEICGCKLLATSTGGAHGGGAALTEEGQALLEAYRAFSQDLQAYGEKCFNLYFSKFKQGRKG